MGKKNLGSVKDLLDDVQLARVDDLRSRSKSEKPNIIGPVMVYAKAFEDLETGEMFFVRHVGFGAGSDGRGPGGMVSAAASSALLGSLETLWWTMSLLKVGQETQLAREP